MKILFIAPQPFFQERGTPIAVRAAVEALAGDGHQVDLLTYHTGGDVTLPATVRLGRIPRPPLVRRVPIGPSWQKAVCDVFLLREAWRRIGACAGVGRYDLVHAVEEAAFMARMLRRRFGVPFVYDMDSLMSEQIADKSRLLRPVAAGFARWERLAIRESLGVLAVCPALEEVARRHHPAGRVALLPDTPLGPPDDMQHRPAAEIAAIAGVRLVYVGNMEPYQGVDLLVQAFARVAEGHPEATLVVVGGRERETKELAKIAPELCKSGRIRFLGARPVSELSSILAGADVLVSPRRNGRNTPMKIYSYLASGRPVLATRLSTHTQVLDDGVAVLAEPTPEGLAAGMRRLLGSPVLREQIGTAGRDLVRREYGQAAFRRRLREFYEGINAHLHDSTPLHSARAGVTRAAHPLGGS